MNDQIFHPRRRQVASRSIHSFAFFLIFFLPAWSCAYAAKSAKLRQLGTASPNTTREILLPFPPVKGRSISNLIYGTSAWSLRADESKLAFPLRRFGGNSSSRYNYQVNATNAASDWFFMNVPLSYIAVPQGSRIAREAPVDVQKLSVTNYWALEQTTDHREFLLTIPMLGWVTKDREQAWSYPVHRYGPQQSVEYQTSGGDAGNGIDRQGRPILTGDASLTSVSVGPEFAVDWLKHLKQVTGKSAANGGVRFVALDNEPSLWHKTHQDLRYSNSRNSESGPVGFDEIWNLTVSYASALKKADPDIQILGPDAWGWCDYFGYGKDQCEQGLDRLRHGGKPFLQWYMQKVCEYRQKHGVQLIDYLDIHYYPATVASHSAETPAEQDKRLQAVRTWYDPTYRDGSWIREPIALIPRMRAWIQESCPGMKLAITEWRWGVSTASISNALAHAESLLIFGREGVDLASLWNDLHDGSLGDLAFKIFLDYDGHGASALGGTSVAVQATDAQLYPAYAIMTQNRVLLYIFNKSREGHEVKLNLHPSLQIQRRFLLDDKGLKEQDNRLSQAVMLPQLSVTLLELKQQVAKKAPAGALR